jgi:hypothetical protein
MGRGSCSHVRDDFTYFTYVALPFQEDNDTVPKMDRRRARFIGTLPKTVEPPLAPTL